MKNVFFIIILSSVIPSNIFGKNNISFTEQSLANNDSIVPNVFSPNGDGNNDLFQLINSDLVARLDMQIFNRWGALVFETNQINEGWNGRTLTGEICPEGTYFYIITTESTTYKGSLSLFR